MMRTAPTKHCYLAVSVLSPEIGRLRYLRRPVATGRLYCTPLHKRGMVYTGDYDHRQLLLAVVIYNTPDIKYDFR